MKRIMFIVMAIFAFGFTFGQVKTETTFGSLDKDSKAIFLSASSQNKWGEIVKTDADSIIVVLKVSGIKKTKGDTLVPTQFLVVYEKDNKKGYYLSLDDPSANGTDQASIIALMGSTGLTQGDNKTLDHLPINANDTRTSNHLIIKDW